MEEQAQTLLVTLRKSSTSIETKLASFNNLKSNIKHLRVPEAAQASIFECIKLAISSQTSPTLVSSGLATLGHLIKRLSLQEQTGIIATQAHKLLPILLDRLGDARESHRNAASQTLSDLWPYCPADVEKTIREGAIAGHNARAKEMGMLWVVKMNQDQGLQFRSFVPLLVACLEDADGSVRETAKSAVVELFRNAPEHAKTDLKKQMVNRGVRKTIESYIISGLDNRGSAEVDLTTSTISPPVLPTEAFPPDHGLADSVLSEQPPSQEAVPMDPLYVHTQRELEDIFKDMMPHFEGKETEHNWMARDKDVLKLRRINKGNAPVDFHAAYVMGVKSLLDGILKVANSLRTTLSTNGCQCIQELARSLGPSLDAMVEILIQAFIKMSANTKPIAANNGSTTVEVLLSHVSYKERLMQHMWSAFQDKNVQTRTYAAGWLKTLIKKHAPQKAHLEHSGGAEMAEKCIRKGLADANPKVRESTRSVYWAFAQIWPVRAEAIMDSLDAKSKQLLESDKNNPNASSFASSVSSSASARPAFNGRASVREAIAAQRRAAAAAKAMPDRPTSAQSILSPMVSVSSAGRPGPGRSVTARPALASASTTLERPTMRTHAPSNSTSGTLMAAPVRRPRRPELARPATADPYATRRAGAQATPTMSPAESPSKAKASTVTKTRTPAPTGPASGASSTVRSKSRLGESHLPRPSPKGRQSTTGLGSPLSTPSKNEELTMVVPFTQPPDDDDSHAAPLRRIARMDKSLSLDEGRQSFDPDGADFTMVLPNLRSQPFEARPRSSEGPRQSITPRQSPLKHALASARLGSPSTSRLRSPQIHSAQRTDSGIADIHTEAGADQVQVYEDPFSEHSVRGQHVEPDKPVLEELPINERTNERTATPEVARTSNLNQSTRSNEQNIAVEAPNVPATPSRTPRKPNGEVTTANGRPDAETLRSRRLLASGIERIRAKTLDAHGFRRVQDLVKTGGDIWGDDNRRYGELLLALLEYLETPNEQLATVAKSGNIQNLKTQVLATVRVMMMRFQEEAQPYAARALCSVLAARRWERDSEHLAQEMERACEGIVGMMDAEEGIAAVVDVVESTVSPRSPTSSASSSGDAPSPPLSSGGKDAEDGTARNARTVVLSLTVLDLLLHQAKENDVGIPPAMTQRLGQLAVRLLHDGDADVRRADLEFCLALHERFGGEGFWKAVVGVKEMHLNLITYYLARRGRA